jgi:hypothetical protein
LFQSKTGLEKTQVLLKKPAGRLNAGFFTGFSGKTGFLKQVFSLKMSIFVGQYISDNATLKYATRFKAA